MNRVLLLALSIVFVMVLPLAAVAAPKLKSDSPGNSGKKTTTEPSPSPSPTAEPSPSPSPSPSDSFVGFSAYVDGVSGSDVNSGSATEPVKTITRGVQLAEEANGRGEESRVVIAGGVYRESVSLPATQKTDAAMLIEGRDGAVLTGVDVWTGWTQQSDGSFTRHWPYKWGMKAIPNGWDYYWNWDGNGYKRDVLRRSETVYINGQPLRLVLSRTELVDGTFFVDEAAERIDLRPPAGVSMTAATTVEVGIRQSVLSARGRRNLTIRGLAVHRSRGAVQESAFEITNSSNITLDGVDVRWHAYAGLGSASNVGVTVRNSVFSNNGVSGLANYRDRDVLMEDSVIAGNNWRGWPAMHRGWDAVHKWGGVRRGTIRRTQFLNNLAHGLWLDWDNKYITIDQVFSSGNHANGAYLEANTGPITIQQSKLCNNAQAGIADARSDNVSLLDNQVFGNSRYQFLFTGNENGVLVTDWETGEQTTTASRGWNMHGNTVSGSGSEGWTVWVPNAKIFPIVRDTITSDTNSWYHSGRSTAFRIPDTDGGAVSHSTYRSKISTTKTNETNSTWGSQTLSCQP